ncbi:MAG: hypothetical protein CRN43_18240 [Candidatus Nephrothrix sp. EaCA]|nr:MAG: hypothetical protein CRN43_18240 [Candidatus Nephrothrix sp. EaCA]
MSILASAPSVLSISHYAEAWVGLRVKPSFSSGIMMEILRCTPIEGEQLKGAMIEGQRLSV